MTIGSTGPNEVSLARALARAALAVDLGRFDADVIAKAKICLLDFLSCAFEARNHPWSRQAIGIAREIKDGATVIGTRTACLTGRCGLRQRHHGPWPGARRHARRQHLPPWRGDLADPARTVGTNAAVRRDIACRRDHRLRDRGADRPRAFTADLARLYRPTGLVTPLGAALAGSFALGLTEDAATSAIAIAANTSSGLNEWPHAGGSEMYFHPGFAARNAIAAIELAEAGAYASETILEGEAGLFAAFRRQPAPDRNPVVRRRQPEIMAVYNKPAPACNFAQTAAQTALRVARELGYSEDIATVSIRSRKPPPAIPAATPRDLFTTRCRPR